MTSRIATRALASLAGASLVVLSGTVAFADDELDETDPLDDSDNPCVVVDDDSAEDADEGVAEELAAAGLGRAAAGFDRPEGKGKPDKGEKGGGKDKDKGKPDWAGKPDKADKDKGKPAWAGNGDNCEKDAVRAARDELKQSIKDTGGSWGREMSRAAYVRVATKLAARLEFLPDEAKSFALVTIMEKIGANLPEDFDYASLFPEGFDFEAVYAYIAEIVAFHNAHGDEDEDDGDDDVTPTPSPSPGPSPSPEPSPSATA